MTEVGLRYPSDLTDEKWALVELLIAPAKRGGNRRHVAAHEVVNGLMYILSTGCQWRAIAKDLPLCSTLYDYFDLQRWDGTLDRIHDALYAQCRQAASREASATAGIIDSQSVKSAEKGAPAIDPTGYDAGKKIKGRKRHAMVDTQGLLMRIAVVHAADVQDRDGGALPMASLFGGFPFLIKLYADGGYQGPEFQSACENGSGARQRRDRQAIGSSHRVWSHRLRCRSSNAPSLRLGRCRRLAEGLGMSHHKASPSCASPPSASCCENYAIPHDVLGQTLSAKLTKGRKATGYWPIMEDMANAGATVLDQPVVVDENVITSRFIYDIPQFVDAIVAQLN